jgi:uncharacterized protein YyaL (SSP411 family)
MLSAADRRLADPVDAVVVGAASDPRAAGLRAAVAAPYAPDLVIATIDPAGGSADRRLASLALFAGKTRRDGATTAYVCRGYACEEPTSDPQRARQQVAGLSQPGS